MLPVGFGPTISAGEWPQTYALDRAAYGIGKTSEWAVKMRGFCSWQCCACEGQSPVRCLELCSETCGFLWSTHDVCHTVYQVIPF